MVTAVERMATMETKMDNIEKSLVRNDKDHERLFKKIDDFINSADHKYAGKDVELRVSKLERHWWKFAGGFIALITLVNWAILVYVKGG